MAFQPACSLDDLWEGDMKEVVVDGVELLLIHAEGGHIGAFAPMCPHQEFPLIDGELEGAVLICAAHRWEFDARTGAGLNPSDCALTRYPVKVEGEQIYVDVSLV